MLNFKVGLNLILQKVMGGLGWSRVVFETVKTRLYVDICSLKDHPRPP